MEMHLTRVILGESKVKGVLKQRKQSKNNSKSRMRRLSTKMEMHPVGVILEDSKVKGVLKQRKQSKIKNKGRVTVKAKSQQKTTVTSLQTTVRATEAMMRPAHLTSPRRDIPTFGKRTSSKCAR